MTHTPLILTFWRLVKQWWMKAAQAAKFGMHLLLAMLAIPAAYANVTALSTTNATQNVLLGSAMSATSVSTTGTPFVPQYLGQVATLTGPAGAGALAPVTAYTFSGPKAIVQASTGDFYVLDGASVLRVNKSTGAVTAITLPVGFSTTFLSNASHMGIDANDNLYLQEAVNDAAIKQITNVSTTPTLGATVQMPNGVGTFAVSPSGDIYGTKYDSPNLGEVYKATVGSATSGTINGAPFALANAWPGYDSTGTTSFTAGFPMGSVIDGSGNFYVTGGAGGVYMMTPAGVGSKLANDIAANSNNNYAGMAFDAAGNLYYAYLNCVRKVPAGTTGPVASSVLSGSCNTTGYVNGAPALARFSGMRGLVTDNFPGGSATGDIIASEISNKALRRVATIGFSVSPALYSGLSFGTDGSISGTPPTLSACGFWNSSCLQALSTSNNAKTYTVSYSNLDNSIVSNAVTITLATAPSSNLSDSGGITTSFLTSLGSATPIAADLTAATSASITISNQGSWTLGLPAPTYSVGPGLPGGLSLNTGTGEISGTPTALQSSTSYTVTATNAYGSSTQTLALAVTAQLAYSTSTPTAVVGQALSLTPSVTTPTFNSYSVSPALPAGLAINASTGEISGTPTAATASATYTVSGSWGSGSTPFALTFAVNQSPTVSYPASTTVGAGQFASISPTNTGGAPASSQGVSTLVPSSTFEFAPGFELNSFSPPGGLGVDGSGNVYVKVSETTNYTRRIVKVSPQDAVTNLGDAATLGLGDLVTTRNGLTYSVNANENLYVVDMTTNPPTPGGSAVVSGAAGGFGSITSVDTMSNGNIVISEDGNETVKIYSSSGSPVLQLSLSAGQPKRVAIGAADEIYVLLGSGDVDVFDASGSLLRTLVTGSTALTDIAISATNTVYLTLSDPYGSPSNT
jgi:hypothetical protein